MSTIDLPGFGAMLDEVRIDTDFNDHNRARLVIAKFFEMPRFIRYFGFIKAGHEAIGEMPGWCIHQREIHTKTMMSYLLEMHGEEVHNLVYDCL